MWRAGVKSFPLHFPLHAKCSYLPAWASAVCTAPLPSSSCSLRKGFSWLDASSPAEPCHCAVSWLHGEPPRLKQCKGETTHSLRYSTGPPLLHCSCLPTLPTGEISRSLECSPCFGVDFCVFRPSSSCSAHQSTSLHSWSSDCYTTWNRVCMRKQTMQKPAAVATHTHKNLHKGRTTKNFWFWWLLYRLQYIFPIPYIFSG